MENQGLGVGGTFRQQTGKKKKKEKTNVRKNPSRHHWT